MNSIAQLASERTSLTLFAQAPSTISFVPLTRNLSPAAPFPTHLKALGTGNALLRYGIRVPCSKRPPVVRDAFSEAFGVKNRLLGYRIDARYRRRAPDVRGEFIIQKRAVPKTPSYGTEVTGYDYCVAGSGWKMRPLPTTRRTPTPQKLTKPHKSAPTPQKHLDSPKASQTPQNPQPHKLTKPHKSHHNPIKLTKPHKSHPNPTKATLLHKSAPTPYSPP